MKRGATFGAALLLGVGIALGATVFRTDIAQATGLAQAVTIDNTAANPVPVRQQGTAQVSITNSSVPVTPSIETQVLVDQEVVDGDRITVPVAAYKTIHFDFNLANGTCFGSGASLLVVEATHFLRRAQIDANDACSGGFTGETIEMPGRSITLIVHVPIAGDRWRVLAFGRAN